MADNTTRLDGSGALDTVATDNIGGAHYQRVKLNVGADGVAADVQPPDADGKVASGLLPAGGLLFDVSTGNWNRARSARGASDGSDGSGTVETHPKLYNGASFDRQRGNIDGTALASAARAAGVSSAVLTNYNARGVLVTLNVTVASGTGGLTVRLFAIDPVTGGSGAVWQAAAARTTVGLVKYLIYPGASTLGNLHEVAAQALPRTWQLSVQAGDASSYTYSLGYSLIV